MVSDYDSVASEMSIKSIPEKSYLKETCLKYDSIVLSSWVSGTCYLSGLHLIFGFAHTLGYASHLST